MSNTNTPRPLPTESMSDVFRIWYYDPASDIWTRFRVCEHPSAVPSIVEALRRKGYRVDVIRNNFTSVETHEPQKQFHDEFVLWGRNPAYSDGGLIKILSGTSPHCRRAGEDRRREGNWTGLQVVASGQEPDRSAP